jgi:hypothetical protein
MPRNRVLPAQQCFGTGHVAFQVVLRLVIQTQFTIPHGMAQVFFDGHAGHDGGLHVRIKKPQRIAPGTFGLVHGQVGMLHKIVGTGVVICEQRNANAA